MKLDGDCDSRKPVAVLAHATRDGAVELSRALDTGLLVLAFDADAVHVAYHVPTEWVGHIPEVLRLVLANEEAKRAAVCQ